MLKVLKKLIDGAENSPLNFRLWASSFLCIIACRILVENWIGGFQTRSGKFLFFEFSHTFLFFLVSFLLFVFLVNKFLGVEIKKASGLLLWGFLIILLPPVADYFISGGKGFWSFYEFDGISGLVSRFFHFFGSTPQIGITYGVRLEVALAVIFLFIYGYVKSKNVLRSLSLSFFSYVILFILGTFPSYVTILFEGFVKGFFRVSEVSVAQMFLTPAKIFSREIPDIASSLNIKMSLVYSLVLIVLALAGLYLYQKNKLLVFARNARYPQIMYHAGLLFSGMGMAVIFNDLSPEFNIFNIASCLLLLSAITCAWFASLVPNDIVDKATDELTPNKNRPLVKNEISEDDYKTAGWTLFFFSIFFSAVVDFKIALFLFVYQIVAWIYSVYPLRLKRFAFISTTLSAIALLMILFSGYTLISPDQSIKGLPHSIIWLLTMGCIFILPIKDFKDIEGDRKDSVYTVPVLFGEQWGKVIVATGTFISFVLAATVLNENRIYWWSFLCGSLSFWIIFSSGQGKKIKYHHLTWWIMGVVAFYLILIIKFMLT